MSLTSNQFKSSTIRGVFNNVDDTVGNIDASANFQRNVSIGGVITQTGTNGFNTLQNVFINGNIAQNVGGTIEQFPGTTDYNILNGTRFRGNVEISGINSVLTVSNFSAGGNCTVGGNLVVGGVDYSTKTSKSYVDTQLATKADISYVESGLATKANISYIDSQLALKVNTTDNTTALATKQNSITSLSRLNTNLIGTGIISNTELNYLNGVSSNLQTQIDSKLNVSDYNSNNTTNTQNLQDQIDSKVNIADYDTNNININASIANKLSSITQNPINGDISFSNSINITNGLTMGGYAVFNNNVICNDELECNGNFLLNGINLNDKLALKSDKTYVDNELALKLNLSDYNSNNTSNNTNLQNQINLKSDKIYVDNQLTLKLNTTDYNTNSSTLTNLINTKPSYGIESTENYAFTNNIFWVL
jgi:hypothetical protein